MLPSLCDVVLFVSVFIYVYLGCNSVYLSCSWVAFSVCLYPLRCGHCKVFKALWGLQCSAHHVETLACCSCWDVNEKYSLEERKMCLHQIFFIL